MFCEIWVDPIPSILQVEPLAIWTGGCEELLSPDSILLLPVMWSVVPESTIHDEFDVIKQLEVILGWAKVALGVCGREVMSAREKPKCSSRRTSAATLSELVCSLGD